MKIQIRKWKMTDADSLAAVLSNQNIPKNLRDGAAVGSIAAFLRGNIYARPAGEEAHNVR